MTCPDCDGLTAPCPLPDGKDCPAVGRRRGRTIRVIARDEAEAEALVAALEAAP